MARLAFATSGGGGNDDGTEPPVFADKAEALRATYETLVEMLEWNAPSLEWTGPRNDYSYSQKKDAVKTWLAANDEAGWTSDSMEALKIMNEGLKPVAFFNALEEHLGGLDASHRPGTRYEVTRERFERYCETRKAVEAEIFFPFSAEKS